MCESMFELELKLNNNNLNYVGYLKQTRSKYIL